MAEFSQLSPMDFEEFVADLMSEATGLDFAVGTRGRDAGIDALAVVDGERHVIQCKHFLQSSVSDLEREAREEAKRLAGLDRPYASYRFITSKPLNHTQRDALVEILEPWVGSRENVLGGNELTAHLKEHFEVERRHPKLWFSGAGQLRSSLSAASYERSRALLDEIRPRLCRYVETDAFRQARGLLHAESVCTVDGPAGVGKTTVAQLLLVDSLKEGFQPFEVAQGELAKAWELLELDEKQVFYFDDFLGHTGLFESREKDRDLVRFIRRVAEDEKRRLILTTRDYILRQAQRKSEILDREVGDAHQFLLTAGRYTRRERARIFYNHIFFSEQVDATARRSLISEGRYLEVIDHEGFNPLVVEWITGHPAYRLTDEDRAEYGRFCLRVLKAPEILWRHVFDEGLGEHERALLIASMGLPDRVRRETLETAFEAGCAARDLATTGRRFQHSLVVLDGSFLTSVERNDGLGFSPVNPSLIDFLKRYLAASRADAEAALRGGCFFEQVEWLWEASQANGCGPPESLWPLFDDAFSRLFYAPPVEHRFSYLSDDPAREILQQRVRFVARCCAVPGFRETVSSWLPARAREWLDGSPPGSELDLGELELLRALLEHGLLDPTQVEEKLATGIGALEPGYPFRLLDAFARLCPETVTPEFVAKEAMALEDYVEAVLDRPDGYFSTADDFDVFAASLGPWKIELDREELESARNAIEEVRAIERREMEKAGDPEDFGLESWGEPDEGKVVEKEQSRGDADDEIDAMFSRLVDG
jgi:hypothetical protein